jgi:hypothetical protein
MNVTLSCADTESTHIAHSASRVKRLGKRSDIGWGTSSPGEGVKVKVVEHGIGEGFMMYRRQQ